MYIGSSNFEYVEFSVKHPSNTYLHVYVSTAPITWVYFHELDTFDFLC